MSVCLRERVMVREVFGAPESAEATASLRYLDRKIREVPDGRSAVIAVVFYCTLCGF